MTINGKTIVYTTVSADTVTTAATAWLALLTATTTPPEFQEIVWTNPSAGVIVATAKTPGTPFTMTATAASGATLTQVHTTANSSPSDVGNAANWLRAGLAAIPVNGDDVIVANSTVPLLWNLAALAAVQFNSFKRYQSFTAQIGLPTYNTAGYLEYRPTYFQFTSAGTLEMVLGLGTGTGPSRERYNVGATATTLVVLASGSPADAYAVLFLGTSAATTISVVGTSLGVAVQPGEVSSCASVSVDGGGSVTLGAGVTISGALTLTGATATTYAAPGSIIASSGSTVTVLNDGGTIATVTASNSCNLIWASNATITTLTLRASCTLNKSGVLLASTITNSNSEVDSCQVIDPNNTITWTNATTCTNAAQSGPFQFGSGRTVKIT